MFSFHKPKIFRCSSGCCICKAKSSSSRFTDSKRYEPLFEKCFGLEEERSGEICNACVLLVKRYMKLPAGSLRHWNHVVDARSGPGIKSLVRAKKQMKLKNEQQANETPACDTPDKYKRKHVYKRRIRPDSPSVVKIRRTRSKSINVSPFLNMDYWTRLDVCCGVFFKGKEGELAIDPRYVSFCTPCKTFKEPFLPLLPLAEAATTMLEEVDDDSDNVETTKFSEEDSNLDADDEGFFDRPMVSPESGTSTPPPIQNYFVA